MRTIQYIVIHEAACPLIKPSGKQFTIDDVDAWHMQRGFERASEWRDKWHPELKAVGYHFVIGIEGQLWEGRHEDEVPAAVKWFNAVSINVCLIGQGRYTQAQWGRLDTLITHLRDKYPDAAVTGHYNPRFKSGKTCPDFNVDDWINNHYIIPEKYIAHMP
jgi:N-acetylmuramoyl-L-alanine amidase